MLYANDMKNEILVSGSVAESLEMLPAFFERAKLPYIVHVDADSSGRTIQGKLEAAHIPKEKILSLRTYLRKMILFLKAPTLSWKI